MAENGTEKVTEQVEKLTVQNEAEKIGNLSVKKVPGLEEVKCCHFVHPKVARKM